MSKFFKVLGIGAALGTIAYGIFKYKHDQKFKEKVDEKKDEAKQQVKQVGEKALDKACIFTVNHPGVVLGIIGGAVVGTSALGAIAVNNKVKKLKNNLGIYENHPLVGKDLEEHEKWWEENGYGDNYRSAVDFAKAVGLHSGEALAIAQYEENGADVIGVVQEYDDGKRSYTKKETYLKED